jgi:ABC-2 type transport system permease protein
VEKGSLLIFIPLSFIYFYSVYQIDAGARKAGADPIFSFLYIYLFNFFYSSVVVAALSGRWVFPSVSVEANNFKLIKNSLIPLGDFLKAKFLLGFIPLFLLGEVLTVVSCLILRIKFIFILVCAVTTGLLCWGVVLIALSWGMRQADFSIQTPLDFALSAKGFLCLIRELIFVTIVIVLVGVPANYFLTDGFSRAFTLSLAVSVTAVFVILSILRGNYKSSLSELSRREI